MDRASDFGSLSQSRWFTAVRFVALCSALATIVPWYASIVREPATQNWELLIPLSFAPLWGPFFWIFFSLSPKVDDRARKKALALAVSWGALYFLLSFTLFSLIVSSIGFNNNEWQEEGIFGGLALLQLSLVAASIKAYFSMKSEPADRRVLLWRLGFAGFIAVSFLLSTPFLHLEKQAPNEAVALSALRNIATAQVVYAENHSDKGFAFSLRDLGPSPGAELIDGVLASGNKSGYTITMSAAPPDSAGRIKAYTITARPRRFGKDGTRSFLTDESGRFHVTLEDRAATIQDPVL